MKKTFVMLIVSLLMFSLTGCSDFVELLEYESAEASKGISFTTVDINGRPYTSDKLSDYDVIMINFWEPWCGPCVAEMPGLESLYETYADKNFLILGVYSSTDMKDEAAQVVANAGVKYPILEYCSEFDQFQSGYVPTTIFVDGQGNVLTDEPIVGANEYLDWVSIVSKYIN